MSYDWELDAELRRDARREAEYDREDDERAFAEQQADPLRAVCRGFWLDREECLEDQEIPF
jgi:hypothetical protein